MPVTLYDFFRVGKKYSALLEKLYDKTLDDDELWRLLSRSLAPEFEPDTALEQLQDYEFLQAIEGTSHYYRLTPHVERLVGKLLKRQHETSARVIRGFLEAIEDVGERLREALDTHNDERVRLAIRDLENLVIQVREMGRSNLDSITTQVEDLTEKRDGLSTQQRYERVNHLWTEIIEPIQQLIEVRAPFDTSIDRVTHLLADIRRHFQHHSLIRRRSASVRFQLVAMRRELLERHREVIREVEPLYRHLRVESQMAGGAATALKTVRHKGAAALEVDDQVALFGWRPEGLYSDTSLAAYVATVADYTPPEMVTLSAPPEPSSMPHLRREEIHRVLHRHTPVDDVLDFVLSRWPDKPLKVLLRAYGWIFREEFGPVYYPEDVSRKRYPYGNHVIIARPISLHEVTR